MLHLTRYLLVDPSRAKERDVSDAAGQSDPAQDKVLLCRTR